MTPYTPPGGRQRGCSLPYETVWELSRFAIIH